MKFWKKLLAALLCLTLALGMAACTQEEEPAVTTTAPTAAPTTETTLPAVDTVITTDAESYSVVEGESVSIDAEVTSSEDGVKLSYTSNNEEIATVNKSGKVTGVSAGTTEIVITSTDGVEKTVIVVVEEYVYEKVLRLALNVMFNDLELSCYNNETGPIIEITEDGTYTVTFSCAENLSESSKNIGITGLNNLTSVYIKDYDVTVGNLKKSNVVACDIRWDSVVVDGVELTITNSEFKSAMKSSGIFDTNDPLNAWDGSSVEEVTVDTTNHVLNINMDNPQTITVTFTISGLEWL